MIQIIGWTILHSLWQVALIASLYLIVKNAWQYPTALKKYYLAVSALGATFFSTLLTFGYLFQQTNPVVRPVADSNLVSIINEVPAPILPIETNEIVTTTALTLADYLTLCLPYLVAFWGLGMFYFTLRFCKNLYGVNKLQKSDNELINSEWLAKIKIFKNQLNIEKEVQVFLSKYVKEPITFGHFKPIILLPISLVTGFDNAAIETIILHELAHIKRNDYLVNLGQSIIEIILFYHPLVWWISREIRELREHCCDDLVLSLGDNRTTYVETLTALQWHKVGGMTNRLSLSASGGDAGFTRRIKRMFGVEEERGNFRQLMGLFLLLLIFAIGGIFYRNYFIGEEHTDEAIAIYPAEEFSYYIDNSYSNGDMDKIRAEIKRLGITLGPCSFSKMTTICDDDSTNAEVVRSLKGSYYRDYGKTIFFESPDLSQFPLKLTFDSGDLKEPERLNNFGKAAFKNNQFNYSSNEQVSFLINDKTRKEDLLFWKEKLKRVFISFSFNESRFDDNGYLLGKVEKIISQLDQSIFLLRNSKNACIMDYGRIF
ncbi:MAG: M56 family metallopeptidase [Saprospiraceae bacterium]